MKKLNKDDFIKMANKIYIEPSLEVLEHLENEYNQINEMLELLEKIDVSNVEPLTRIALPIDFLREDIEDNKIILDKSIALSNAKEKNKDFVVIKRILK